MFVSACLYASAHVLPVYMSVGRAFVHVCACVSVLLVCMCLCLCACVVVGTHMCLCGILKKV